MGFRSRDQGREESDDRSRLERYEGFLRSLDTNRNGRIDANEAEGGRGMFVRRLAERAGVEADFPLSISRLREGLQRHYSQENSERSNDRDRSPSNSQSEQEKPLVPGFGVEVEELPPPLEFGKAAPKPGAGSNGSASSRSNGSSRSGNDNDADDRVRRWAESIIRQNDRNRNGRLERDEWGGLRGNPRDIDRNRDGVITREEMTAQLNAFRRGDRGDRRPDREGSGDSGDSSSSSAEGSKRKSYRFLTPTERLTDLKLPDWFIEKDANGDGQVAMAEYSRTWTTSLASQFAGYDHNGDGLISPKECLTGSPEPPKETAAAKPGEPTEKAPSSEERAGARPRQEGGLWDGW